MASIRKAVLILVTMAIALPLAAAQTDVPTISLGDTVEGVLESGHLSAQYLLAGNRGDVVTITLSSDEFDGYLTLLDPGLNKIAEDDDSAGGSNPMIDAFTLPTSGDFTIVVESYSGLDTGAYSLSVSGTAAEETETAEATAIPENIVFDTAITVGDTIQSSITADVTAMLYPFQGRRGQRITIEVNSRDFDSYLTLKSESGVILAEDDDGAGNLNARIQNFELPADGTYSILVSGYSGEVEGEFSLTVTEAGTSPQPTQQIGTPQPTPTFIPTPEAVPTASSNGVTLTLRVGDQIEDAIAPFARSNRYAFEGESGQIVTISVESDAFDTYVTLQDANGNTLAEDDDSAGSLNARIQNFELPANGRYIIEVSSFSGVASGAFILTLAGETTVVPDTTGDDDLVSKETFDGTLTDDMPVASFPLTGRAGERVTITLESSDFDSYLTLNDASDREIAADDDSAGNLNAQITDFVLPADGTYIIEASSLGNLDSGDFTLTVERRAGSFEATAEPTQTVGGEAIHLGDRVRGELTDEARTARYTFEGSAGQIVRLTLLSGDFDPVLRLLDADGNEVASDDDSAGNLNARIEGFALPADGTYTIVVSSFGNMTGGAYSLALDEETGEISVEPTPTAATATPTPSIGDLGLGDTVEGELRSGGSQTYRFQGEAGQLVTITLSSRDFDTFLRLLGPNQNELISDDDSAGSLDSRIAFYRLPESGLYTIVVESYDDDAGHYSLSLTAADVRPIEYTQTIDGRLTQDASTTGYRFRGSEGDTITISLNSTAFDAYLRLAWANGESSLALITDDDSGVGTNARIGPYRLPETGDYLITVSSFDSTQYGAYTLHLDRAAITPIAYDEAVEAEISEDTLALYYSFEGASGDVISIHVDSGGTVDTSLSLVGPDQYEIAADDDSGADFDPEISRLVLSTDGIYTIGLHPYSVGDSGEVTLTVSRAPILSLDDGPQEIRLNEKVTQDVLTFTGEAGENYQLSVQVQDGVASPSVTITQDGQTVATASASNSRNLLVTFVVPDDGTVNVQISDYSFVKVVMTVSVEAVEE